jgi:hypothetical protein
VVPQPSNWYSFPIDFTTGLYAQVTGTGLDITFVTDY